MSRKLFHVLVLIAMLVVAVPFATSPVAASQATALDKVEPLVLQQLAAKGQADFFLWLADKADVSGANQLTQKVDKGQFVFDTLVATAQRTQKDLLAFLDSRGAKFVSYFIVNRILVQAGDQALLQELAARADVAQITANHTFQLDEPINPKPSTPSPSGIEPNITFVKADQVWALGFNGQGMIVADDDTGLDNTHPAIARHYRGCLNPPDCTLWDHNYNWFDAFGTSPAVPWDDYGHGTHTMGTMVGDDGAGNQIGMAPGAKGIACKNMMGGGGDDQHFLICFQWNLAPTKTDGTEPRPDLAPDSVNNSWGYWGGGVDSFREAIDNLLAAGIVVEVSAGNEGAGCASLRSPGDYQEVFTTGSVNHAAPYPGTITGFSSRGPSDLDGNYFPDFMAPGENVRSALPGNQYAAWSGTSMAGPHVTALIALLWSANPALRGQINTTYDIIEQTAARLVGQGGSNCGGDYVAGPNNDWGYGTIDSYQAALLAISYGGAGILQGTVTDSVTGLPIEGATIQAVRDEGGSWTVTTGADGFYQTTVAAGTFTVTASHSHYMSSTVGGVVVPEDGTTVQDFSLAPRGYAYGHVTDADNGTPLVGATVADDFGNGAVTDATGYYELWLDPGTWNITAVAEDYAPEAATVTIVSGQGTLHDFALQAAVAVIPSPIHVTVPVGGTFTQHVTIFNRQPWAYDFQFRERDEGYVPPEKRVTSAPVPDGAPIVPQGASSQAAVQPYKSRIETNPILVLATTDVSQSVERALNELGYAYDYINSSDWTGIDFSPYDVVFVGMDGGTISTSSIQKVRTDVIDAGKRLVFLGGTCWQEFANGVNQYLVQNNTGNYCWQITGSPMWTIVDPSHPLADGLPSPYNYANSSAGYYQIRVNDPDVETVAVNGESWPAFFLKNTYGGGEFIWYIDSVYSTYWGNQSDFNFLKQIVDNALNYSADVTWLSEDPAAGTVPANGSLPVDIIFDATGLQPGDYLATLTVNGDPRVTVPVNMTVGETAGTLHLNRAKFKGGATARPGFYKVVWSGRIHDQDHLVAGGVTVLGTLTFPDGTVLDKTGVTNSLGLVKFPQKTQQTGVFEFCVTDLQKAGYAYNPGANETPECRTVTVTP